MAYDDTLAQRIRTLLADDPTVSEKKMFGGLAFLQRGLMVVGVAGGDLMARVGKEQHAAALRGEHVREMDFTGRPMQGYVTVGPAGTATDEQLRDWLDRCQAFVRTLPARLPKDAG